jgi:DNA polymerase/3'-5' exonuclease PolX
MSEERELFSRDVVTGVLVELSGLIGTRAVRVCAVGGWRRGKSEMKDLELLYIPRLAEVPDAGDLFGGTREEDLMERFWESLLETGVIEKRLTVDGRTSWGAWIKLARHVRTGLPLDLFAATAENWWNRLVVTTGPREQNVAIAAKAHEKGWDWEVAQAGFVPRGLKWEDCQKSRRTMRGEAEVFSFVDLEMPWALGRGPERKVTNF